MAKNLIIRLFLSAVAALLILFGAASFFFQSQYAHSLAKSLLVDAFEAAELDLSFDALSVSWSFRPAIQIKKVVIRGSEKKIISFDSLKSEVSLSKLLKKKILLKNVVLTGIELNGIAIDQTCTGSLELDWAIGTIKSEGRLGEKNTFELVYNQGKESENSLTFQEKKGGLFHRLLELPYPADFYASLSANSSAPFAGHVEIFFHPLEYLPCCLHGAFLFDEEALSLQHLQGQIGPFILNGSVKVNRESIALSNLSVQSKAASLKGRLQYFLSDRTIDGETEIKISNFQALSPSLGKINCHATASCRFDRGNGQSIQILAESPIFSIEGMHFHNFSLSLDLCSLREKPVAGFTCSLERAECGRLIIEKIFLASNGALGEEIPWNISLHGVYQSPFILETAGKWNLSKGCLSLTSDLLNGSYGDAQLSGRSSISITIKDLLNKPHLAGIASIENSSFESATTGALFKEISAKIAYQDNCLIVEELAGKDNSGGNIRAKGSMDVIASLLFPYRMAVSFEKTELINLEFANAKFSGEAEIKGNIEGATLVGSLKADSAELMIQEQGPSIPHLEVTYINQSDNLPAPTIIQDQTIHYPLHLNLSVSLPQNGIITDKNLFSKWKGHIDIKGTLHSPLLFGQLKSIEGEYKFNGKPFRISEGLITFDGHPKAKTSLYVIASRDIDHINAQVIVKGAIGNPSLSFRSNPPLPEKEVLSWLLFNRGLETITPAQGEQLSKSITTLSAGHQGPELLKKLRAGLGIDSIDITRDISGESNKVSVKVGKYISKGVFVSVSKSLSEESNKVGLEADITKNLKVQAEIGDDAQGQLKLKWKKHY